MGNLVNQNEHVQFPLHLKYLVHWVILHGADHWEWVSITYTHAAWSLLRIEVIKQKCKAFEMLDFGDNAPRFVAFPQSKEAEKVR